jgi:hypothetical protein
LHVRGAASPAIERMRIKTSFLQRFPGIGRHYRWYLPLMPAAVDRWQIAGDVDLVVSLSHAVAKRRVVRSALTSTPETSDSNIRPRPDPGARPPSPRRYRSRARRRILGRGRGIFPHRRPTSRGFRGKLADPARDAAVLPLPSPGYDHHT